MKEKEAWYNHRYVRPFCENWNTYLYKRIFPMIKEGSTILDVGCGSGEFLTSVAGKVKQGYGVDTSDALIKLAKEKFTTYNLDNIFVENIDFFDYFIPDSIDTISMIFVLHEVDPTQRLRFLKKALHISKEVIIADYSTPQPPNLFGAVNWLAELLTEKAHFSNFKQFHRSRWIEQLYLDSDLHIIEHDDVLFNSYKIIKFRKKR